MSVMSGSFHITGNTRDDQSQQSMLRFNKSQNGANYTKMRRERKYNSNLSTFNNCYDFNYSIMIVPSSTLYSNQVSVKLQLHCES